MAVAPLFFTWYNETGKVIPGVCDNPIFLNLTYLTRESGRSNEDGRPQGNSDNGRRTVPRQRKSESRDRAPTWLGPGVKI